MKSQGEMHEFNETAHLVELEAEDEEEHLHEAGVICWLRKGTDLSQKCRGEPKNLMKFKVFFIIDCFLGGKCMQMFICGEKDASKDEIMMRCPLDPRANT